MKDAIIAISFVAAAIILLKALTASFTLYVGLLPFLYLYGLQTCPSQESFDAKAELKRVLRGDQLPADHPQKPKSGTFSSFLNGAMAAMTAEMATLPGYEVELWNLYGAAWVVTMTIPTSDLACTWIGCNHKWYYCGSRRLGLPPPEEANLKIGNTNIKFDFKEDDIKIKFGSKKEN